MKRTAAFLSLGCKVNSYETEAMRGMFEAAGYEIVDFKDAADVYVVNTCTVTNIADHKSRQMLHQAKRRNPRAVIAAVGCYVQAAGEALLDDRAVDLVIGNNKKSDIVAIVERYREGSGREELITGVDGQREYEELPVHTIQEKTRAFIKIQDGCDRFCSYCIIPYVRGRIRSRREEDILDEIGTLAQKGFQEVVLTGIHLSSYGKKVSSYGKKGSSYGETVSFYGASSPSETESISETASSVGMAVHSPGTDSEGSEPDMPLAELIIKIGRIPGIERIRLGSLEPGIITGEFLERISRVRQFCPHFHLSLQSGSDSVLKRMNRRYLATDYYEKAELIKSYFPLPAFTTDVIVGFPGERSEEFRETVEFVKKIGFSHLHVFKYSRREGTAAARMPGQISEDIKNRRSEELISVSKLMEKEYRSRFLGRIEKILFEEEMTLEGNKYQAGHNERYLKLAVCDDRNLSNQLLEVKVIGFLTEEILLGEIIH